MAQGDDVRAMFFAALCSKGHESLLEKSALLGHAPAQAFMAQMSYGDEFLEWVKKGSVKEPVKG